MRRALFFIVAVFSAATSFASIPRASMHDRASEDASAFAQPLSETRVWASQVLAPFEHPVETELTRALRQAYGDSSTTDASGLGRFLSVDPGRDWDLRQPQSWNMYSYVRNNPINRIDPTGRCGEGPNFIGPKAPCAAASSESTPKPQKAGGRTPAQGREPGSSTEFPAEGGGKTIRTYGAGRSSSNRCRLGARSHRRRRPACS
jgi:hypothetical protein